MMTEEPEGITSDNNNEEKRNKLGRRRHKKRVVGQNSNSSGDIPDVQIDSLNTESTTSTLQNGTREPEEEIIILEHFTAQHKNSRLNCTNVKREKIGTFQGFHSSKLPETYDLNYKLPNAEKSYSTPEYKNILKTKSSPRDCSQNARLTTASQTNKDNTFELDQDTNLIADGTMITNENTSELDYDQNLTQNGTQDLNGNISELDVNQNLSENGTEDVNENTYELDYDQNLTQNGTQDSNDDDDDVNIIEGEMPYLDLTLGEEEADIGTEEDNGIVNREIECIDITSDDEGDTVTVDNAGGSGPSDSGNIAYINNHEMEEQILYSDGIIVGGAEEGCGENASFNEVDLNECQFVIGVLDSIPSTSFQEGNISFFYQRQEQHLINIEVQDISGNTTSISNTHTDTNSITVQEEISSAYAVSNCSTSSSTNSDNNSGAGDTGVAGPDVVPSCISNGRMTESATENVDNQNASNHEQNASNLRIDIDNILCEDIEQLLTDVWKVNKDFFSESLEFQKSLAADFNIPLWRVNFWFQKQKGKSPRTHGDSGSNLCGNNSKSVAIQTLNHDDSLNGGRSTPVQTLECNTTHSSIQTTDKYFEQNQNKSIIQSTHSSTQTASREKEKDSTIQVKHNTTSSTTCPSRKRRSSSLPSYRNTTGISNTHTDTNSISVQEEISSANAVSNCSTSSSTNSDNNSGAGDTGVAGPDVVPSCSSNGRMTESATENVQRHDHEQNASNIRIDIDNILREDIEQLLTDVWKVNKDFFSESLEFQKSLAADFNIPLWRVNFWFQKQKGKGSKTHGDSGSNSCGNNRKSVAIQTLNHDDSLNGELSTPVKTLERNTTHTSIQTTDKYFEQNQNKSILQSTHSSTQTASCEKEDSTIQVKHNTTSSTTSPSRKRRSSSLPSSRKKDGSTVIPGNSETSKKKKRSNNSASVIVVAKCDAQRKISPQKSLRKQNATKVRIETPALSDQTSTKVEPHHRGTEGTPRHSDTKVTPCHLDTKVTHHSGTEATPRHLGTEAIPGSSNVAAHKLVEDSSDSGSDNDSFQRRPYDGKLPKTHVKYLRNIYKYNHNPGYSSMKTIAKDKNIPYEKVKRWFQNRRKEDRDNNSEEYERYEQLRWELCEQYGRRGTKRKQAAVAAIPENFVNSLWNGISNSTTSLVGKRVKPTANQRLTEQQLRYLSKKYSKCSNPGMVNMLHFSKKLSLPFEKVQDWFNKARTTKTRHAKREEKPCKYAISFKVRLALLQEYQKNKFPNNEAMTMMAHKFHVRYHRIAAWFSNMRRREKIKSGRMMFDADQKEELLQAYRENPYPTKNVVEDFAKRFGVPPERITSYFYSKRWDDKKRKTKIGKKSALYSEMPLPVVPKSDRSDLSESETSSSLIHVNGKFIPQTSKQEFAVDKSDNSDEEEEYSKDLVNICGHCGLQFTNRENHMRFCNQCKFHTYYECDTCGRSFLTKISLAGHLNEHLDKKFFQCSHCLRSFRHRHSLNYHLESVHMRVKRFICKICSKAFSTKFSCNRHTAVHVYEKPLKENK